jgi:hypothetical protein
VQKERKKEEGEEGGTVQRQAFFGLRIFWCPFNREFCSRIEPAGKLMISMEGRAESWNPDTSILNPQVICVATLGDKR